MSDAQVAGPAEHIPSHGNGRLVPWRKGHSGNPGGRGGDFLACVRKAREASPEAMDVLIELMRHDDDSRVRAAAANAVLDRAWGKPKEQPVDNTERRVVIDAALATPAMRAAMLEMINAGVVRPAEEEGE